MIIGPGITFGNGVVLSDIPDIIRPNLYANYDALTGISGSTFNDSTGNGHNATLFNGATTTTSNGTQVLRLNAAASQYFVDTNSYNNDLDNAFTYDVWCCPLTGSSPGVLIGEWDNSNLNLGGWTTDLMGFSNTTIQFGVYNTGYVTGPGWTLLNWYNIVMTYDVNVSPTLNAYVNTAYVGSTDGAKGSPATTYLTMGAPGNDYINIAGVPYFNGYIGAWKIYNRALTSAEVKQNFAALRSRYGV
jgi:hypothetical protein